MSSWDETLMLPFGAAQRSLPIVHSTYDGVTSVTTGASSYGFHPNPRFTSCVALGKLLHLYGDWFSHLQDAYNMTWWWSRGNMSDAAKPGTQPSGTEDTDDEHLDFDTKARRCLG